MSLPSGDGQGTPTVALLGDLAFLHDVSGLVNLPERPVHVRRRSTTAGEGSSRSCRRRRSVEPAVFERLFGTPPTSDIGAVARGFGLPVHEVTALSQLESALAAPHARARAGAWCPGRAQNVALHDAINQAVRLALR